MTPDPDLERYDHESAVAMRRRGWYVVPPEQQRELKRCPRRDCLTLIPLDRARCTFHRRPA